MEKQMKTSIKYIVLSIGLGMSAASFAGLNELGSSIASGSAGIVSWTIDSTSDVYRAIFHPGMKLLGDSMDKTAGYMK